MFYREILSEIESFKESFEDFIEYYISLIYTKQSYKTSFIVTNQDYSEAVFLFDSGSGHLSPEEISIAQLASVDLTKSMKPYEFIFPPHINLGNEEYDRIKAIVLSKSERHYKLEDETLFIAGAFKLGNYNIFVIININNSLVYLYPNLASNFSPDKRYVGKSYLHSMVYVLFSRLFTVDVRRISKLFSELFFEEYLLNFSSTWFISRLCFSNDMETALGISLLLNRISTYKYEKKEVSSQILFLDIKKTKIDYKFKLQDPFKATEYRKFRKMLETTDKQSYIICDGNNIYGVGNVAAVQDPLPPDSIFKVSLLGQSIWELYSNDKLLFRSEYGNPVLKTGVVSQTSINKLINDNFPDTTDDIKTNLYVIVKKIIADNRGAIIIFSDLAEQEVSRLGRYCYKIEKVQASLANISLFTSVDGAVILDNKCNCLAFGAILDGISCESSDIARGSRYNSTLRYFEHVNHLYENPRILGFIISDDGMVDLLENKPERSITSTMLNPLRMIKRFVGKTLFD